MLKLEGPDLDREDAGAQRKMPLEFLEEVMELREALEGLRAEDLGKAQPMAAEVAALKGGADGRGSAEGEDR